MLRIARRWQNTKHISNLSALLLKQFESRYKEFFCFGKYYPFIPFIPSALFAYPRHQGAEKKSQKAYCPLRLLYIRYAPLWKWNDVGEAHKCHGEQAGSDKGDRHTTHALRNVLNLQTLADTRKQDKSKSKAHSDRC